MHDNRSSIARLTPAGGSPVGGGPPGFRRGRGREFFVQNIEIRVWTESYVKSQLRFSRFRLFHVRLQLRQNTQEYTRIRKDSQKYAEIRKKTQKYVKNTQKYTKIRKIRKKTKNTQKFAKIHKES